MAGADIVALLRERFPEAIKAADEFRGETTITVASEVLRPVMTFLSQDASYDLLVDLAGVDEGGDPARLVVVYLLHSLKFKSRLRIKVPLEGGSLDTVSDIWKAADWLEREAYDMFGITFRNHPDLRRILLEEDFEGHPLRKDFPLKGWDWPADSGQGGDNG